MNCTSEFASFEASIMALQIYNIKNNIKQPISDVVIVDVGAGQPVYYSNSHPFRELGAKVIAVEPIKRFCDMFVALGYEALNYAACEADLGEVLFRDFYAHPTNGLSGSGRHEVSQHRNDSEYVDYMVPALTLNTILERHHPDITQIDVLDIDTEGTEMEVIKGLDMVKYRPKVIIMENIDHTGKYTGTYGYNKFYEPLGYEIMFKCAHNDILIRK